MHVYMYISYAYVMLTACNLQLVNFHKTIYP